MTSQEKVAMAIDDLKREALFLPYAAYLKPVEIIAWALPQIARELMGKGVMQ